MIYCRQWKYNQEKMTGFSVFRQVFGKGADKELTAFLLHFWDSSQEEQGLCWDQHSPELGSEAFEPEVGWGWY